MDTYSTTCGEFTDYSLKYVNFLVTLCENNHDISPEEIYQGIKVICSQ